jgi:hypothetical protein
MSLAAGNSRIRNRRIIICPPRAMILESVILYHSASKFLSVNKTAVRVKGNKTLRHATVRALAP